MKLRHMVAASAAAFTLCVVGAAPATSTPPTLGDPPHLQKAYPQTRPSAGQFCKRIHRGRVTRAKNGRRVRCMPAGSRHRWRYY